MFDSQAPAKLNQKNERVRVANRNMDDLFDIIGISLFASRHEWCRLTHMPCIPTTSCDEYIIDGKCPYSSDPAEETKDRND
ncbi:MAG: hypothetical protein A4E65_01680 [Syntrophorhabdus sp. PtaU1.Bin153]|nr:MAG: hypothetical protein A4E65_01680 [Syntrophorhabdus sp. PtaU1.Bin153]